MLTCKTLDCQQHLQNIEIPADQAPIWCGLCGVEMTADA